MSSFMDTAGDMFAHDGLGALFDPVGAADRAKARRELADRFVFSPDGTNDQNTVSSDEFDRIAALYSDIRLGRTHLDVTPDELEGSPECDAYRAGLMSHFADILQTEPGRMLLEGLARQEDLPEDQRHAVEMSPFYDRDWDLSLEEMDAGGNADGVTSRDERAAGGVPLHDVNARIRPMKDGGLLPFDAWRSEQQQGHGLDTMVAFNPGDTFHAGVTDWGGEIRPDIMLFHELTHAYHAVRGTLRSDEAIDTDGSETNACELQAVGLLGDDQPQTATERALTENAYRAARAQMAGRPGALPDDAFVAQRTSYATIWEN